MERSKVVLIAGAMGIVIVIIAIFATGAGNPIHDNRPGYGAGGQQTGAGLGQGHSTGPGGTAPHLLPITDTTPLAATEAADILYMREEEQMAHDLYTRWAGMYEVPVFSNIAASETQHISEVGLLMDRYGLPGDRAGNASAGYRNTTIQSLYTALAKKGDASQIGAFEAGLAIEEQDIADLDHTLAGTTRADVIQVWTNLRLGSENHRNAFLRQLDR